jgi:hypothetical protein
MMNRYDEPDERSSWDLSGRMTWRILPQKQTCKLGNSSLTLEEWVIHASIENKGKWQTMEGFLIKDPSNLGFPGVESPSAIAEYPRAVVVSVAGVAPGSIIA